VMPDVVRVRVLWHCSQARGHYMIHHVRPEVSRFDETNGGERRPPRALRCNEAMYRRYENARAACKIIRIYSTPSGGLHACSGDNELVTYYQRIVRLVGSSVVHCRQSQSSSVVFSGIPSIDSSSEFNSKK